MSDLGTAEIILGIIVALVSILGGPFAVYVTMRERLVLLEAKVTHNTNDITAIETDIQQKIGAKQESMDKTLRDISEKINTFIIEQGHVVQSIAKIVNDHEEEFKAMRRAK